MAWGQERKGKMSPTDLGNNEKVQTELRRLRHKIQTQKEEIAAQLKALGDYRAKEDARVKGMLGPCEQCGELAVVIFCRPMSRSMNKYNKSNFWCINHAYEFFKLRSENSKW